MNEEVFHDAHVFQTYSYLARLLAGEDIIVRWNVRGLDGPAEMDMVRRVLDIAPIQKGKEHLIPGIIFHELGHFLWTSNLSKRLNGQLIAVDEGAYELFISTVKSKYVWNIIEDGYSERKTVAKYPGALKHLRLLYDEDKANFKPSGNIVIDTLNTLQMNVLGGKWNESFPYDERLPKKLVEKLHKARSLVSSTEEERVELASDILELLHEMPGWSDFTQPSDTSNASSERTTTSVDELGAVVLGAAGRQSQLPSRVAGTDSEQQERVEEDAVEEVTIEEFISDNAAKILGSNKYYLETIVDKADPNGRELYIPTPDEVKLVSDITDIWHPALKKPFKGWTFNRFIGQLQGNQDGRRLYSLFSKKIEQSKVIAQTMFQQFITRANAQNIAMRKRKTTGILDVNRLALHQVYDDVFAKRTMSPNQVNHAYVVMVDWSSSMHDSALELFHRICELIFFARLANVELDIWLYTTNDRMVRGEHIEQVGAKLRDDVLLTGSIFAQAVNTKLHNLDEVMFRLMFLFVNGLMCKKVATDTVRGAFKWFTDMDVPSTIYIPMSGTNIFEAIQFATERARSLRAERKAVILMTDGDDKPTFDVIMDKGKSGFASDTLSAKSVMYKGIDLLQLAEKAEAEVQSADYKYGSENPFKNLRTGASYLVAEDARKDGIPIVGITWGSFTSKPLLLITQDNTIRLNISSTTLRSKNPTTYESVTNTFITKITEALLRHSQ